MCVIGSVVPSKLSELRKLSKLSKLSKGSKLCCIQARSMTQNGSRAGGGKGETLRGERKEERG